MAPAHDDCDFGIISRWEEILEWCPMPPPASPASTSASGSLIRHALSCPSTPLPRSRAPSTSGQSAVTPSEAAQSGRFSETTKAQVKAIYGGSKRCWVCRGGMADCAHVFAMEDDQTDCWDKAGLIPPGANLKSKENAIFLCKSCHCQFDNAYNPGIVFFPADLEFFIEWETADQARRKEAAQNGVHIRRSPPTAAAYKAHQVEQARVDSNSIGGLYRTAILDTFFASDLPKSVRREVIEYRSRLKQWHGEPMYTIRHAFIILGTLQVKLLDPEIKRQLRELQDLYTSDDLEDDDDDSLLRSVNHLNRGPKRPHPGPEDGNNAGSRGSVHGNPDDGEYPGDPQTSPKDGQDCLGGSAKRLKRSCRSVDETALACHDLVSRDHLLLAPHRTLARRWQLGPDMTTEDAIRIRSHLMAPAY